MTAVVAGAVLVLAAAAACRSSSSSDSPSRSAGTLDAAPAVPAAPDAALAAADVVSSATDGPWTLDGGPVDGADARGRVLQVAEPLGGGDGKPRAPVYVARGDDAADMVERALDGAGVKVPTGRRVVIKVNLGGFDRMKPGKPDDGVHGRTTDAAVVRALVVALRARGVKDIVVADARSAPAEEWPTLLALSGYGPMLDELGVPFVDLNDYDGTRSWRVRAPWAKRLGDELVLSDVLVGPDAAARPYLISVAKLKAHRFAVMSLSIKNLMGAVMMVGDASAPAWRRRWRMHRELSPWLDVWKKQRRDDRAVYRAALAAFSERLADLYGILTPDLAVVAGLPAVQGDGFAQVVPYGGRGVVIVSENACYADWVAARFFGWDDSDVLERELGVRAPPAVLAVAERYFGGARGLAKIEVRGDAYLPADEGRAPAWFKAMAPFELGAAPTPRATPPAASSPDAAP